MRRTRQRERVCDRCSKHTLPVTVQHTALTSFAGFGLVQFAKGAVVDLTKSNNLLNFEGFESTTGDYVTLRTNSPQLVDYSALSGLTFHTFSLLNAATLQTFAPIVLAGREALGGPARVWISGAAAATGALNVSGTGVGSIYVSGCDNVTDINFAIVTFSYGSVSVVVEGAPAATVRLAGSNLTCSALDVFGLWSVGNVDLSGLRSNITLVAGGFSLYNVPGLTDLSTFTHLFTNGTDTTSDYYSSKSFYDYLNSAFGFSPPTNLFAELLIDANPSLVSLDGLEVSIYLSVYACRVPCVCV